MKDDVGIRGCVTDSLMMLLTATSVDKVNRTGNGEIYSVLR